MVAISKNFFFEINNFKKILILLTIYVNSQNIAKVLSIIPLSYFTETCGLLRLLSGQNRA